MSYVQGYFNYQALISHYEMAQKKASELTEEDIAKFDWLTLHKDMDKALPSETTYQKFMRKFYENPFVPVGCLATSGALIYGIWSFRRGERKISQYMMRTRVVAQGLTIVAMIVGVTMSGQKSANKVVDS